MSVNNQVMFSQAALLKPCKRLKFGCQRRANLRAIRESTFKFTPHIHLFDYTRAIRVRPGRCITLFPFHLSFGAFMTPIISLVDDSPMSFSETTEEYYYSIICSFYTHALHWGGHGWKILLPG